MVSWSAAQPSGAHSVVGKSEDEGVGREMHRSPRPSASRVAHPERAPKNPAEAAAGAEAAAALFRGVTPADPTQDGR
jgi:hypothetical protein